MHMPRLRKIIARRALAVTVAAVLFTGGLPAAAYADRATEDGANSMGTESLSLSSESAASTQSASSFSYNNVIATGKTAEEIVSQMTLEQQIQQMIVPALRSYADSTTNESTNVTVLTDELRATIEKYRFGGIILFGENCVDTAQATTLTHDLAQTAAETSSVPLIIPTDQEGGTVTRLNSGTSMPGNMAIAATGSVANATTNAEVFASELAAVGINADFAPDLDVNTNPANPVIGVRSFSSDPALVSAFGTAYIQGLQSEGIATTVKHFPGHGDTATDSHTGLPKVDKSLAYLQSCDLIPFQAGIDAGCDMVMTAHIQFPQIETATYKSKKDGQPINLPATLSSTIITNILRQQMSFEGVVSTDSLVMDAISTHFETRDSARLAINAGVDILLMPVVLMGDAKWNENTPARFEASMDSYVRDIMDMVATGETSEDRIKESAARIVQMKIDRGIITDTPDTRTLEQKIASAQEVVGSSEHRATERELASAAITITQDIDYALPLNVKSSQHIVAFSPYASEARSATFALTRMQSEGTIPADATFEVITFDDNTTDQTILDAIGRGDAIVALSTLYNADELKPTDTTTRVVDQVIAYAHEQGKRAVVLSAGLPYDAARYPDADGVVLAYNPRGTLALDANNQPVGTYGPNIPAAFDVIFGKVSPGGTLPVDIMKLDENYQFTTEVLYSIGYGITNLEKPTPDPVPTPDPTPDPTPTPAPTPDPAPDPTPDPTPTSAAASAKALAKTGDSTAGILAGAAALVILGAISAMAAHIDARRRKE